MIMIEVDGFFKPYSVESMAQISYSAQLCFRHFLAYRSLSIDVWNERTFSTSTFTVIHDLLFRITLLSKQLEKAMATHSSTLAWKIPWMEEPGRLQSMGSLRVRHN